jgi:hypothetical protein
MRFQAKEPITGTWLTFHRVGQRETKITFGADALPTLLTDGLIVIEERPPVHLPLLMRGL